MAIIDKVIDFLICKVSPFIILGCGIGVGYLIGSWFSLYSESNLLPKIIGAIIGFIIFGIIARFAWTDLNDADEVQDE